MQFELKTKTEGNYLDDWETIDAQPCAFEHLGAAKAALRAMINALPSVIEYRVNELLNGQSIPGGTYIIPDDHAPRLKALRERPIVGPNYSVAFVRNAPSAYDDYDNLRNVADAMLSVDNAIEAFGEAGLGVDEYDEAFVIAVKVAFARSIDFLIFLP